MKVLDIEEYGREALITMELTEEEVELILKATDYKYYIESAIVHILEKALDEELKNVQS